MNKQKIVVPREVRYISDWNDFTLPDHPCIIDKKLTGCGFTEYALNQKYSNFNTVLVSPRKALLENKEAQHMYLDDTVPYSDPILKKGTYYARCDKERELDIDKDLEAKNPKIREDQAIKDQETLVDIDQFKKDLNSAIDQFISDHKPIKICVTNDSFRKVREVLEYRGILNTFNIVVDEFQAIFTDSKFKSDTELELLTAVSGIQKLCFISATPMMEEYLDQLDEFKDLPYYELDWESENPGRIIHPEIIAKPTRSINETAKKIITEFKEGKYQKRPRLSKEGIPEEIIEARELMLYVNSIKNIADIIRQNKLMPEDVNVICANTEENAKKIRDAFRAVYVDFNRPTKELPKKEEIIGSVPIPNPITGEVRNKPITLCTKTVYLGADFYSHCARSIVLSDSGIECLAVDITLDLPQILGRQRLQENPWKNSIEIFFKAGAGVGEITQEQFDERVKEKIRKTESLLESYGSSPTSTSKHDLAEEFERTAKRENYKRHYVAVNKHNGSDLKPQFNNLVMIAERRAYDIQKIDYKDRFAVYNSIDSVFGKGAAEESRKYQEVLDDINSYRFFTDKMKRACEIVLSNESEVIYIPEPYRTYIYTLGISAISGCSYQKSKLDSAMISRGTSRILTPEDIDEAVFGYFQIGQRYTKAQVKIDLGEIYEKLGIVNKPKASDLEKWFNIKEVLFYDSVTKKRSSGFEILGIKQ